MTTARVVTTLLRLMPVVLAVYSSDDPCGRHVAGREPCPRFSPRGDFSIALPICSVCFTTLTKACVATIIVRQIP